MVKILFFDTETTGLPKQRYIDPVLLKNNWPDLVSLSYKVYDFDGTTKTLLKTVDKIVIPNGWNIPDESVQFHKITQNIANEKGEPLEHIINEFMEDLKGVYRIIAHNLEFDKNVLINVAYWRLNKNIKHLWPTQAEFCTFETYKKELGNTKQKKDLNSLYMTTFNKEPPANAHNSRRDVDVLDEIFWERWGL
jgi:DNA polymerase III epsilon subunit-like protein